MPPSFFTYYSTIAMSIGKSASKVWREQVKAGNTSLAFSPWLTREKEKMSADGNTTGIVLVDQALNDSVHVAIKDAVDVGGLKSKPNSNKIFGINKTVFIVSSIILIASIGGGIYLLTQTGKK